MLERWQKRFSLFSDVLRGRIEHEIGRLCRAILIKLWAVVVKLDRVVNELLRFER